MDNGESIGTYPGNTTATPKNCCPAIRVKNEWEPKGKVYNNIGDINGRQYWVTDKNAIWFDGDRHTASDWMYGKLQNIGERKQETAQDVVFLVRPKFHDSHQALATRG